MNFIHDDENPINTSFPKDLVLKDESGNVYNLENDKGKIIVLDLWSSSCGVCFKKFPDFEFQKEKYKNDHNVKFYSLNLRLKRDSKIDLKKYTEKYSFKTLYADEKSWKILNNQTVPKLLIIDKNSNIVYKGTMHEKWYHFYKNFNSIINKLKNE